MSYPIVILGSGRGTNAEALLKAESQKKLGAAKIAAIVSDQPEAGILALGQKYQVPAIFIDPGQQGARLTDAAEQAYIERIQSFSPKLIVLAGFMRIIRRPFIEAFEGCMINLHPSLLPSFPGINGVRQAYDYGVKISGCTVHWVTPELDAGPIIDQKEVRVDETDTLDILSKKIHIAEHTLLPDVVTRLSKGKLSPPNK
ncbi:MAG: phosphoribosylglycinamide formyltransferase [Puniceicoccaceae bacterium]|nr:MAG: phosphoribosylglycinamide formyltransferase [Puniceicoccaceae bacterium]